MSRASVRFTQHSPPAPTSIEVATSWTLKMEGIIKNRNYWHHANRSDGTQQGIQRSAVTNTGHDGVQWPALGTTAAVTSTGHDGVQWLALGKTACSDKHWARRRAVTSTGHDGVQWIYVQQQTCSYSKQVLWIQRIRIPKILKTKITKKA